MLMAMTWYVQVMINPVFILRKDYVSLWRDVQIMEHLQINWEKLMMQMKLLPAFNYNPEAVIDDGGCEAVFVGCDDVDYLNTMILLILQIKLFVFGIWDCTDQIPLIIIH